RARWRAVLRGFRPGPLPWIDGPMGPPARHAVGLVLDGELHAAAPGEARALPAIDGRLRLGVDLDEQERLVVEASAGPTAPDGDGWRVPFVLSARGDQLVEDLRLDDAQLR